MPLKLDGTYGVYGVVGTASSAAVYGVDADSGIVFSGNQTLINSDGSTIATIGTSGINVTGIVTATSSVRIGTGTSISSPATNVLVLGTNNTEKIRVGAAGSIGIGTNIISSTVDIFGLQANTSSTSASDPTGTLKLGFDGGDAGETYGSSLVFSQRWFSGSNAQVAVGQIAGVKIAGTGNFGGGLAFFTSNGTNNNLLERLRINSSGDVGIGTNAPGSGIKLDVLGGEIRAGRISSAEGGQVSFSRGSDNATAWYIDVYGASSTPDLRFVDATSSLVRATINSTGDLLLGTNSTGAQIEIDTDNTYAGGDAGCGIRLYHTSTSLGSNNALLGLNCATTNASTYRMAQFNSGTTRGAFGDAEFVFYGNGTANADGSWVGGGADYAEYFEWSDGNDNDEDRRGISVVLDGNKIREALMGEDPIGVISGNPSVVGDAAWNKWSGKYLRDDYGSYVRDENGERQLNPTFNPNEEYVPREQRPEWDCVGLMGKLRVRKGQITGSRWIKMCDVSDTVEEWLVR